MDADVGLVDWQGCDCVMSGRLDGKTVGALGWELQTHFPKEFKWRRVKGTKVTLPKFYETALQQQIWLAMLKLVMFRIRARGRRLARCSKRIQGTDQMASAFGMPTTGGQQYMPSGNIRGWHRDIVHSHYQQAVRHSSSAQSKRHLGSFTMDPLLVIGANAA